MAIYRARFTRFTKNSVCTFPVIVLNYFLNSVTFLQQNLSIPGKISKSLTPDYVFEVHHPPKVQHTWQKRKEHKETFLAYHGSRIENFYSILKIGLQQHFSSQKVVLFGDGIYLTSEITVSANYAPFGQSWKNSIFGSKHSIIAVCEVINNVEKVKCKGSFSNIV